MTVAELMAKLAKYNKNAEVISLGPDCGGYDCEWGDINAIKKMSNGCVFVGHIDPTNKEDTLDIEKEDLNDNLLFTRTDGKCTEADDGYKRRHGLPPYGDFRCPCGLSLCNGYCKVCDAKKSGKS